MVHNRDRDVLKPFGGVLSIRLPETPSTEITNGAYLRPKVLTWYTDYCCIVSSNSMGVANFKITI